MEREIGDDHDWKRHCLHAEARLEEYRNVFDGMTPNEARRLRNLEAVVEAFVMAHSRDPVVGILLRDGSAHSGLLKGLFEDQKRVTSQ